MKNCDFIPADYHERGRLRAAMKLRVSCIGTMFVLMLLWFVSHQHRVASAEAMLQEADQQRQQVQIHAIKQESLKRRWDRLHDRRRLVETLSQRAKLVLVFADLSRRMPDRILLTKLDLNCSGLSRFIIQDSDDAENVTTQRPSDRASPYDISEEIEDITPRIKMTGLARSQIDVISFAAALESSPLFDQIEMTNREIAVWGGRRAELFDLTCALVPHKRKDP